MTAHATRPTDLAAPDLSALALSFRAGEPVTAWRAQVMADPTQASLHGLNGQPERTGGAGWLHATIRLMGAYVMLLVGHGRGTEPTWANVGNVKGSKLTWVGLSEMHDCPPKGSCSLCAATAVRVMRQRLAHALLLSLGYRSQAYLDGKLLASDRAMVGATCQREGCHRPLTTPESILSGYGPTCGGRVKAPRTWANVDLAARAPVAMRRVVELVTQVETCRKVGCVSCAVPHDD